MKKLKIWHTRKHDDHTVTEIPFDKKRGVMGMAKDIAKEGGFFDGNGFVPWHRVNYFELSDDE